MRLTKEDFDSAKTIAGDVMIQINALLTNEVKFNGGFLEIVGMESDRQHKNAVRYGTIAKMPYKTPKVSTDIYHCELDAEEGDTCWFDGHHAQTQIAARAEKTKTTPDIIFYVDDKMYISVPQSAVVATKRGEEIIAQNGFILGTLIEKPNTSVLPSGIIVKTKPDEYSRVKVTSVSKNKPEFKETDKDTFRNTDIKVGEIAVMENFRPIYLDKTYAGTSELVRFQSFVILSVENEN